ncbi:C39 family peptidase [Saccharopolyspora indica]|uniref:C39 family peptidase n=1 Tax=Saccharopolyspora indica TaxID=1229659 RepID=UPI0022EB4DC5|nr:C39 family peptidase [Saccharopolyspora indica]MDA3645012.1 C39 family peptidase [Saccharopolyspora indica]
MFSSKLAASTAALALLVTGAAAPAAALSPASSPTPAAPVVRSSGEHVLEVDYQVQETGYWCGPAATRIALSARGIYRSQAELAAELGTHTGGTDWIGQVTRVLGGYAGWYETKEMPDDPPTQAQKDLLWNDIVVDIDNGYPIVANIVAPPGNQPPGYPPDQTIYHYFTVIGYNDVDRTVLIADPASFGGNQIYWLTFDQLASLIPPKGYSA